jgi:hypothetical protein
VLLKRAGKDPGRSRGGSHSQLTTTMNVYVHDLEDGLGGAVEARFARPARQQATFSTRLGTKGLVRGYRFNEGQSTRDHA